MDVEAVGGDEAVVEDVFDVGLSGETVHGGCVVFGAEGLGCCDAEVRIALREAGSGGDGASLGVCRDDGVAIDDQIVVRDDVAWEGFVRGGALRAQVRCESEGENGSGLFEPSDRSGIVLQLGRISTRQGWDENGHDSTSVYLHWCLHRRVCENRVEN